MASPRVRPIGTWVLAALGFALPTACLIAPETVSGPCEEVGCDDGNPCTDDICSPDGFCDYEPAATAPSDQNDCTDDLCDGTTETHANKPDGTRCGHDGNLECKAGKCECETKEQCGTDTACITFSCQNGGCSWTTADEGTDVDGLAPGDCKKRVCDDAGNIIEVADAADAPSTTAPGDCKKNACDGMTPVVVADPTDVPPDDDKPCTMEGCNGDTPILHVPVDDGTPCGSGPLCAQAGEVYQTLPQQTCQAGTCAMGSPISCGLFTCNMLNTGCLTACNLDTQCVSSAYCDAGATTCLGKISNGQPCQTANQCVSGFCADGVCCNAPCNETCRACNMPNVVGICVAIAAGQDPSDECPGAQTCNGNGACGKVLGEGCSTSSECSSGICSDGVCCNADCSASCRACDQAGSMGTCVLVPAGQQAGFCNDSNEACDGQGNCKLANGQSCTMSSQCASGFCPSEDGDGRVCCNNACDGLCRSCRADKTNQPTGTCGFIDNNTDPDGECPGMCGGGGSGCCNGAGACK